MEFASEMVVKAALADSAIAEVPTTLSPDGRPPAALGAGATAGAICASCCCSARAGCSSTLAS